MQKACEVLEQISTVSGRNDKTELVEKNKSDGMAFLFETAFNPYLNYGVRDFDDGQVYRTDIPTLVELKTLRQLLVDRKISGGAAKEAMQKALLCENKIVRKWLTNSFVKVFRCGVASGTINKVYPKLIPEFQLQLCENGKDISKEKMDAMLSEEPWMIEPKFDGLRCIMIFEGGFTTVLSRNGRPLNNLDGIANELRPHSDGMVIDGEIYGTDWSDSISLAHSEEKESKTVRFYVFDAITVKEFATRHSDRNLAERKRWIAEHLPNDMPHAKIVPFEIADDYAQAWQMAKNFKEEGFEGAVIKKLSSGYEFCRTMDWLKLKFEETADLEIIDVVNGTGRNAKRLGAFICKLPNGNNVNVGGGFSDKLRDAYWKDRTKLIGQVAEVKYQEETKKDGTGSIRFPVFVRMRPDKS